MRYTYTLYRRTGKALISLIHKAVGESRFRLLKYLEQTKRAYF